MESWISKTTVTGPDLQDDWGESQKDTLAAAVTKLLQTTGTTGSNSMTPTQIGWDWMAWGFG